MTNSLMFTNRIYFVQILYYNSLFLMCKLYFSYLFSFPTSLSLRAV